MQLAGCREPDPIAGVAEWLADRSDEPDAAHLVAEADANIARRTAARKRGCSSRIGKIGPNSAVSRSRISAAERNPRCL